MTSDTAKVRLTGLWKKQSKAGDTYLEGTVSPSSKLLIFQSKEKAGHGPDYVAYLVPNEPKEKQERGQQQEAF